MPPVGFYLRKKESMIGDGIKPLSIKKLDALDPNTELILHTHNAHQEAISRRAEACWNSPNRLIRVGSVMGLMEQQGLTPKDPEDAHTPMNYLVRTTKISYLPHHDGRGPQKGEKRIKRLESSLPMLPGKPRVFHWKPAQKPEVDSQGRRITRR